ncbi:MAG: hypothetical protein HY591_00865 [Candidatus Omnitrophica bacterium]|nr:hypothetical protein [Candidatus Omnitrophota bacterium]
MKTGPWWPASGIDFKPDKINVQVQTGLGHNNGREIKFNIDRAMLQQLDNAPGFEPVVLGISPMPAQALPGWLGLGQ